VIIAQSQGAFGPPCGIGFWHVFESYDNHKGLSCEMWKFDESNDFLKKYLEGVNGNSALNVNGLLSLFSYLLP
jgi:hypothetical protein